MSSTNRSKARDSHVSDYYVTPVDSIKAFLKEFMVLEPWAFSGHVLDPCAGGDAEHRMSYPSALTDFGITPVDTLDIREDSPATFKGGYLGYDAHDRYRVIITNPPFNMARTIIEKALRDVQNGGYVIMLLRLNFFGSRAREDLWREQTPKWSFVHSRRMSFTDDGKTDSIEYMHCVWQKGYYPEFTKLKVI